MKSILKISDEQAAEYIREKFEVAEEYLDQYDADRKQHRDAVNISALVLCQNGYKKLAQQVFSLLYDPFDEVDGSCGILARYYEEMKWHCIHFKDDEEDDEDEI